jgi:hypothetical protein
LFLLSSEVSAGPMPDILAPEILNAAAVKAIILEQVFWSCHARIRNCL